MSDWLPLIIFVGVIVVCFVVAIVYCRLTGNCRGGILGLGP